MGSWVCLILAASLGPEVVLQPHTPDAGAVGFPFSEGLATDGTDLLFAWGDERLEQERTQVYTARVRGTDLQLLEPNGLRIEEDNAFAAGVAYTGGAYAIAWIEHETVWIQFERQDGTLVLPAPLFIDAAECMSIAGDGQSTFLLVYYRDGPRILKGVRFDPNGTRLDATPLNLTGMLPYVTFGVVSGFGAPQQFIVAYAPLATSNDLDYVTVNGATVSGMSTLTSAPGLQALATTSVPGVGAWVQWSVPGAPEPKLSATLVSAAAPLTTTLAQPSEDVFTAQLAIDDKGEGLLVAALGNYGSLGIVLRTVSLDGGVGPLQSPLPLVGSNVTIAFTDGGWFVGGASKNDAVSLAVTRVGLDLSVSDAGATDVRKSASGQFSTAVAASPFGYLVAWCTESDTGDFGLDVYYRRFDTAGVALEPPVNASAAGQRSCSPSAAWDGTQYVLAYENNTVHTRVRKLSTATGVLGPQVTPPGGLFSPRVLPNGVIVGNTGSRIGLSSPLQDGGYAAPLFVDDLISQKQTPAAAVANDGTTLVAWTDKRNIGMFDGQVFAARVSSAGVLLDGIDGGFGLTDGDDGWDPEVVATGNDWLVLYFTYSGIYVRSVRGTVVSAPVQVAGFCGSARLVPEPYGAVALFSQSDIAEVQAVDITVAGGVDAGPLYTVVDAGTYASQVSLAGNGNGTFMLAYAQYDVGPNALGARARLWFKEDAGGVLPDGGVPPDGGVTASDGGMTVSDGGVITLPDGGTLSSDGGMSARTFSASCGCGATDTNMLALVALLLTRVRRRRGR